MVSVLSPYLVYDADAPSDRVKEAAERATRWASEDMGFHAGRTFHKVGKLVVVQQGIDTKTRAPRLNVPREPGEVVLAFFLGSLPGGNAWRFDRGGYISVAGGTLALAYNYDTMPTAAIKYQVRRYTTYLPVHELGHAALGLRHADEGVMSYMDLREWLTLPRRKGFSKSERQTIGQQKWLRKRCAFR